MKRLNNLKGARGPGFESYMHYKNAKKYLPMCSEMLQMNMNKPNTMKTNLAHDVDIRKFWKFIDLNNIKQYLKKILNTYINGSKQYNTYIYIYWW